MHDKTRSCAGSIDSQYGVLRIFLHRDLQSPRSRTAMMLSGNDSNLAEQLARSHDGRWELLSHYSRGSTASTLQCVLYSPKKKSPL